jgi:DNA polymerase-3 subunit gamma/tau
VSYQVIARKYRPQNFDDLTGQEHITRTLSHALDGGRLHHAYIFSGVRGTGKTTTARILAKGLNCHRGTTSQPCLTCPSCLEIAAGNSMDVLEIDAASNTGVDNVREVIINNIALAPARDRFKVFVIDEVHMLSTSAFNALLKTLEEPPSHVVFIMATTELHKVPETILSRCQQFEFRQIPTEKIFARLREIAVLESVTIAEEALREIARAGAGSLRDAQSAFDQVIAFSGNTITVEDVGSSLGLVSAATLREFVEAIAHQQTTKLLDLVEEIYSRGYDARNFTRELMASFRHLLFIKSGIESAESGGITDVEAAGLKSLASHFSEDDLVRSFRQLAATEKEIKDSPQPRFELEMGLIGLARLRRLRPLEELIGRLEVLAGQLEPEGSGVKRVDRISRPVEAPPPTVAPVATASAAPPPRISTASQPESGLQPPPSIRMEARVGRSPAPAPPAVPPSVGGSGDEADPFFDSEPIDLIGFDDDPAGNTKSPPRSVATKVHSAPISQSTPAGAEIKALFDELQRLNRGLIETALAGAQLEYQPGLLVATFGSDDTFAQRIRDSGQLFRSIGEKLFGKPLQVEVRISGEVAPVVNQDERSLEILRQRAMENPVVRRLIEQTKGEITHVNERKK